MCACACVCACLQEEVKARDGADPRKYAVMTKGFQGDAAGNVTGVKIVSLKARPPLDYCNKLQLCVVV